MYTLVGQVSNFYIQVLGLVERTEEKEAGKSWRKYLQAKSRM